MSLVIDAFDGKRIKVKDGKKQEAEGKTGGSCAAKGLDSACRHSRRSGRKPVTRVSIMVMGSEK